MRDVDDLAQFIRRIDGNHTMGAGALAEAIVAYQVEALLADDVVERAAHGIHAMHDRGDWDDEGAVVQDEYREMARAALAAALGDDE